MAGGQGGAIKAGRAFVELFVEDNKLYRGLDRAGMKFKGWGQQLQSLGAMLGGAGGGILAPLVLGLRDVTEKATGLQLLADRIGESVATTSTLAGGFERAGVSADSFAGILEGLRTRVAEAADANAYLLDNLRSLGPAARLAGLPTRELLNQIADAIHRIPAAVNQLRAAKALGLEGILPQLRRGREGVDELFADGGPGAVSAEQGRQAVEVTRAATKAWKDFKDTIRAVFYELLPTAAQAAALAGEFRAGLGQVRGWIKENRGLIVVLAGVGLGLTAAGIAAVGLGLTVAVVGKGILLTVAGVKLAFGALLSPVGLAAAAVAGLFYVVATQTEAGRQAVAGLRDDLAAFAGRARESLAGISNALGAGDWSLAWQIGLAAMKAEWANFTFYLQLGWNVTKSLLVDTWKDAVAGLKLLFIDLGAFVGRQLAAISRAIIGQLATVVGAVDKQLGARLRRAQDGIKTDAQINADRDAARDRVLTDRQREQSEATEYRDRVAREALEAREAARSELGRLNALAAARARWAELSSYEDFEGDDDGGPAQRFHGPTRLADVVKGGFGSHAAIGQQLGMGDSIPQQQLDATRGVMANTSQVPQMARDLNQLARGGRLGP